MTHGINMDVWQKKGSIVIVLIVYATQNLLISGQIIYVIRITAQLENAVVQLKGIIVKAMKVRFDHQFEASLTDYDVRSSFLLTLLCGSVSFLLLYFFLFS